MKVAILFVTGDALIMTHVGSRKHGVVPGDALKSSWLGRQNASLALVSYAERVTSENDFRIFVRRNVKNFDAVMIAVDARMRPLLNGMDTTFFIAEFNAGDAHSGMKDYFERFFSRAIKNFGSYLSAFSNQADRQLLLLPIENFIAEEMNSLKEIFRDRPLSDEFTNQLSSELKSIRERKTPKQFKRYKKIYIVDDNDRHYDYGNEVHSKFDTKSPPHSAICELKGNFRFGGRFDPDRHFNVSEAGRRERISGNFHDCHGDVREVQPTSHINMFPNDFFG